MSLTDKQRHAAREHAMFLVNHKASIGYAYGGGLEAEWIDSSQAEMAKRFAAGEIWSPDCRAAVLWVCKWSGWKSPTGLGWAGSSSEMWQHLPHLADVADAHLGTLVTYGAGGEDHVCMVLEADGDDPWVFSHGSAEGPLRLRLANENTAHVGEPITFLSVAGL